MKAYKHYLREQFAANAKEQRLGMRGHSMCFRMAQSDGFIPTIDMNREQTQAFYVDLAKSARDNSRDYARMAEEVEVI